MKKLLIMFINILMMLICSSTVYGQKIMKLDDELKANSTPMEAKLKGISILPRYEFGPYKVVSGKTDWGTGKSTTNKFSSETYTEYKGKSSFVFTVNAKDTILVNTMTNANYSKSEREGFFVSVTTLNGSLDNYTVLISPYNDTTFWKMILVSTTEAKAGGDNAEGLLTNGVTNIQIRGIKQWEDGKNTPFMMIIGYGFFIDNNEIAAVQSKTNKMFVWLHQNLDEQMKSVLAAASASLMVHTFANESL
jgi:hypothetical protein